MSCDSCAPPIGTKDDTRHVLRRGDDVLIMTWQIIQWCGCFPNIGEVQYPPSYLVKCGWHYAGPCPPLPELPKETWEIAEEALSNPPSHSDYEVSQHFRLALNKIAAMKRRDAP